ncbi:MAG TPA: YncE family protein [Gaiellales bacterium]|nr:YncE family protein [Gaiellales bacterium]
MCQRWTLRVWRWVAAGGVAAWAMILVPPVPAYAGNVYAHIERADWSPKVHGIPERVYVPNSESGTVTEIDPHTFRIIRTFETGYYDQHVTPGWSLRRLYVDDTHANALTEIDVRTGLPTRRIATPSPYNLYFTPDGRTAIVVAEELQRLDFYGRRTWKLRGSVSIPSPGPDHLDFSASGRSFLISCEYSGVVYRVNVAQRRITGRVAVGGLPIDVKLGPQGHLYYVANQGLGGVSVISAGTLRVIHFIPTGAGAHGMAIGRSGRRLYVSNRLAGSISAISFRTGRVVKTWDVGGSPDMLQVSPDGGRLWASNRFDNTVSVINTRTGGVVARIPVGASPHGLAFFPQPGRYSLGHNGVYR